MRIWHREGARTKPGEWRRDCADDPSLGWFLLRPGKYSILQNAVCGNIVLWACAGVSPTLVFAYSMAAVQMADRSFTPSLLPVMALMVLNHRVERGDPTK
jgi:hypothetical protein